MRTEQMKTVFLTKSGGGFMRRILIAAAVVLSSLGATRPALADPAIELVSGNDIVYYDGTSLGAVCSTDGGATSTSCATDFGAVGVSNFAGELTVQVLNFNGWTNISDSAEAYTPSCSSSGTCESQNQLNTTNTAAPDALLSYFGASGFTTQGAITLNESGTLLAGTASAMAYAYTGDLGLSGAAVPNLSGQIGSTLSVAGSGNGTYSAGPTSGPAPATTYNLASEFSFTPGTVQGNYNMTETISTAVPESSSVSVLLVMLLGIALVVRRLISHDAPATQTRTN
jgi:hypothetical protein